MDLKSLLPGAAAAPSGPAAALERLRDEPTRARRAELLEALRGDTLLLAVRELPEDFDPAGEEAPARFLGAEVPGVGRMLCAFSGTPSLTARAPSALALSVPTSTLARWMLDRELPGLLLDPGGAATVISPDEARGLLGLGPLMPRTSISLGDAPENAVISALEALLEGGEHAPIELREPRTGKSIRFERAEEGQLRMILDASRLSADERARAEMLFDELAGGAEALPPLEDAKPDDAVEALALEALFSGDLARPARAALKIFTWVFGFPPGFEVEAGEA